MANNTQMANHTRIWLTPEEKRKFQEYCFQQAFDDDALAKQCEKLGQFTLAKNLRMKSISYGMVFKDLVSPKK